MDNFASSESGSGESCGAVFFNLVGGGVCLSESGSFGRGGSCGAVSMHSQGERIEEATGEGVRDGRNGGVGALQTRNQGAGIDEAKG